MGWNVFEGTLCHTDFPGPGTCATIPTVPPLPRSHGGRFQYRTFMAVTGGFVYRGSALPSLFGKYVFALYGPNTVYTVSRENNQVTLNKLVDTPTSIARSSPTGRTGCTASTRSEPLSTNSSLAPVGAIRASPSSCRKPAA